MGGHTDHLDSPGTGTVAVNLVRRRNRDGVVHRYRADLLADTGRDTIPPACDPTAEHDRAYLAAAPELGGVWHMVCYHMPSRVRATP